MDRPMIYFFDVPVYRLPEDKYYAKCDSYIEETMFPNETQRQIYERSRDQTIRLENYLQHAYGDWDYNEIIGYIRLHFLGSQIRREYFGVQAKRIVRTRRKTFEYKTYKLAPEIEIPADASNEDIYRFVQYYLKDCQRELKGRHLDTEKLDVMAPYVDWRGLLESVRKVNV